MMLITFPCGHAGDVEESAFYDGDEGPCPTCEDARMELNRRDAALISPLREYIDAVARCQWPDEEENTREAARTYAQIDTFLDQVRRVLATRLEVAMDTRVQELRQAGEETGAYADKGPIDLLTLLTRLGQDYRYSQNALAAAENGIAPGEAAQAFWLFTFDTAVETVRGEVARRLTDTEGAPTP